MKKWIYQKVDKELADNLANECGIERFIAVLLSTRGLTDPFEIDEFLSDDIFCCDPYAFADLGKAAERINSAIENKEKIAIFGDYDCDGITSTVLMYSVLKELSADVIYKVPSRDDGYGIKPESVDELKKSGVSLIITVDNGITAFEAVEHANKLKIDVVITDHHLPGASLPDAAAVVDPHRSDCMSEFKDYAGVGVAFMLCSALSDTPIEDLLYTYGDLVALGTISDIMPLLGDNRVFVKHGLKFIRRAPRIGIKALADAAGLDIENITSTNIAFTISPRINASGRILHPSKAVELLLCESEAKAKALAQELCSANVKRQALEKDILDLAILQIKNYERLQNSPVTIVCGDGWHKGVIGIVAAKLVEMFSKPAIVFSVDKDFAYGSARGYEGISIYDILANNTEFFESFGGHSTAAGLTVKKENFENAMQAVINSAKSLYPTMPFAKLVVSCKLNPAALSVASVYLQRRLEPFGEKNPIPIYELSNMIITDIIELSNGRHLKLLVSRDGNVDSSFEVMKFFTARKEFAFNKGDMVDIAVTIDTNFFRDSENLSIIAKDIKLSSQTDEIFDRIRDYQNFKFFSEKPDNCVLSRDDIVAVFKKIRILKEAELDERSLISVFQINDYFKVRIILDVLKELEFIDIFYNGKLKIEYIENAKTNDLSNSKTFRLFCKGEQ